MQIAVTSKGAGLGAWLDPDFTQCLQVVIVDEENYFQSWPNPARALPDEAGISLARRLADEQVSGVVTGSLSEQALEVLMAGGIRVFLAQSGPVLELVEAARAGKLPLALRSDTAITPPAGEI